MTRHQGVRKNFTAAEEKRIVDCLQNSELSLREIGKRFDCSSSLIFQIQQKYKIPRTRNRFAKAQKRETRTSD